MNELKTVESLGITLPGPMYIFGAIIFGLLGYAAYRYGKKTSLSVPKWIGVALMFFPYAVSNTVLLYIVGTSLCLGVYLYRK